MLHQPPMLQKEGRHTWMWKSSLLYWQRLQADDAGLTAAVNKHPKPL